MRAAEPATSPAAAGSPTNAIIENRPGRDQALVHIPPAAVADLGHRSQMKDMIEPDRDNAGRSRRAEQAVLSPLGSSAPPSTLSAQLAALDAARSDAAIRSSSLTAWLASL
jgi:hypothetical protein